jgi:predicted kinase
MKLIILNGPSGVGKSTIALRLQQELPSSALIDVDELRRAIPDYRERRKESLMLAYEKTAEAIEDHLRNGQNVIIDKAISGADILDSFIEIGKRYDAEIYEILLFADKETIQKRADERGYRPGSLLTREKVGELWDKADALRKERSSAILIDTSKLSPGETFMQVRKTIE